MCGVCHFLALLGYVTFDISNVTIPYRGYKGLSFFLCAFDLKPCFQGLLCWFRRLFLVCSRHGFKGVPAVSDFSKTNWVKVGAALAVSPQAQRFALALLLGSGLGVGVSSSVCDIKPDEAARGLWHLVHSSGAARAALDLVPVASEIEVFEILDAVAAGVSVADIGLIVGRPSPDVWAIVASTL
jgi:hypothetical protein